MGVKHSHPCKQLRPRGCNNVSARTHVFPPSPPLSLPLPCGRSQLSAQTLDERNFRFSVFGFQSPKFPNSPNSPNSPSSSGFAIEAARRRRFFRPSFPSHPSKLYSSLGWLNSKVPKPFPPFFLRLIDVDGF
jgi:hypothetical protein